MKTDKSKQSLYHSLGKDYFWFYGHYALARFLLKKHWRRSKGFLLNIGCGPNEQPAFLPDITTVNADYSYDACRLSAKVNKGLFHVCCDADHLPFKTGSLDIITALEILEHLENDRAAGSEFSRTLKLEGFLLVSVPAYKFLWGSHDEWNNHYRRYSRGDLKLFASQNDMTIKYLTWFKIMYVLPLLVVRKVKTLLCKDKVSNDFVAISSFTNKILGTMLYLEALVASVVPLPAGVSLFAVLKNRISD